jgi:hypothetical protein
MNVVFYRNSETPILPARCKNISEICYDTTRTVDSYGKIGPHSSEARPQQASERPTNLVGVSENWELRIIQYIDLASFFRVTLFSEYFLGDSWLPGRVCTKILTLLPTRSCDNNTRYQLRYQQKFQ